MKSDFDVILISAFGRENWLASELREMGLSVGLLDVSDQMGRWSPEDWEGPFGLFRADSLTGSQMARLEEEDYSEPVDSGLILWLKEGPLDMNGPISSYLLNRADPKNLRAEYFSRPETNLESASYQDVWLFHLAHQLGSHVFLPNHRAATYGKALNIFSPYFIRRVSRRGCEKSLDLLADRDVTVFRSAKIRDLRIHGRVCEGFEVEGPWTGVVHGRNWVWGLTSEESRRLGNSLRLYPQGEVRAQWYWTRFVVQLSKIDLLGVLPLKFVLISDNGLPWSHENLLVVQRTVNPQDLDIWMRIPTQYRFQRDYIRNMGQRVVEILNQRIPSAQAQVISFPPEFQYDDNELGPPRFPVFGEGQLAGVQRLSLENFYYDSCEDCVNMDWASRFKFQETIFSKIKNWKIMMDRAAKQTEVRP